MRIKRGQPKQEKRKKLLKQAKGYTLTYSKLYRRAKEALMHAGAYSYAHRRRRRSDKRNEWIKVIAAGLVGSDVSYSKFVNGMKAKNIELDRKVLAEMAQSNPDHFKAVIAAATK